MRVLMSLSHDPNTLEHAYVRGLAGTGCEVHGITLREHGMAKREHLGRRLLRRFAPALGYAEANRRLLTEAARLKPDVVWLFKGMEIYPSTLKRLAQSGITLVNYNPDHPLHFSSSGSGNANVTNSIPLYHLHLTYGRPIARRLEQMNPDLAVSIVPFGHEISDADFNRVASEPEIERVCFVGAPDPERRATLLRFIEAGLPVDVYGMNWNLHLQASPLLRLNGFVTGDGLLRTLRRYRVQLNTFRPHNAGSHNMRSFEVPAAGGIMLADDSPEHHDFFEAGSEAFYFTTPGGMIERAREILAMPKEAADAVRAAARYRSMVSGYTYADRARAALAAIETVHRERHR